MDRQKRSLDHLFSVGICIDVLFYKASKAVLLNALAKEVTLLLTSICLFNLSGSIVFAENTLKEILSSGILQ